MGQLAEALLHGVADPLLHSKYGPAFEMIIKREYVKEDGFSRLDVLVSSLVSSRWRERVNNGSRITDIIASIKVALADEGDPSEQAIACAMSMQAAFSLRSNAENDENRQALSELTTILKPFLRDPRPCFHGGAAWAYAWLGEREAVTASVGHAVMSRLFELWYGSQDHEVRRMAAWAFSALPILDRGSVTLPQPDEALISWLIERSNAESVHSASYYAPLVLAYYWRRPWSDREIGERVAVVSETPHTSVTNSGLRLLNALGPAGAEFMPKNEERQRTPSRRM